MASACLNASDVLDWWHAAIGDAEFTDSVLAAVVSA
jgi:hypothetical protein